MNILRLIFFATALWAACTTAVQAHAFLDSADPPVGGTVHGSPTVVKIWFTRDLKPEVSTVAIFDAREQEIDRRDAKVDPSDPNLLAVSLPKLAAGTYKVVWTAVCLRDGHTTHGSFTFTVADP